MRFLLEEKNSLLIIESCWAIANLASGTTEQVKYLIERGIIPILINLLNSDDFDILEQVEKKYTKIFLFYL